MQDTGFFCDAFRSSPFDNNVRWDNFAFSARSEFGHIGYQGQPYPMWVQVRQMRTYFILVLVAMLLFLVAILLFLVAILLFLVAILLYLVAILLYLVANFLCGNFLVFLAILFVVVGNFVIFGGNFVVLDGNFVVFGGNFVVLGGHFVVLVATLFFFCCNFVEADILRCWVT